ncbi:hypothetical protein PoB_003545600 [Plakobranchus ocellatus]|uniref:Uncharacterized protein n=1 Tax=Plakobranchus ocellatus TaxID=259542 RepID=A0AAV4ACU3_9GAST|nr:hypothetical protein PoB_003545600 [Plakobranchus ocellatus]
MITIQSTPVRLPIKPFAGTVDSEPALRSAGVLLSWVRAPPLAPWLDKGFESLKSHAVAGCISKTQDQAEPFVYRLLSFTRLNPY